MDYNPIKHYNTLGWDIEYWQQYIDHYQANEIHCDERAKLFDLRRCKLELRKAKHRHQEILHQYLEYFI